MPRPNRNSQEFFYDTFSDMPIEDQAAALKICEQVHRLAVREAKQKTDQRPADKTAGTESGSAPEQGALIDT